jgi:hypothetical protein
VSLSGVWRIWSPSRRKKLKTLLLFFTYHTSLCTESPTHTYCSYVCIQGQKLCFKGQIDVLSAYKRECFQGYPPPASPYTHYRAYSPASSAYRCMVHSSSIDPIIHTLNLGWRLASPLALESTGYEPCRRCTRTTKKGILKTSRRASSQPLRIKVGSYIISPPISLVLRVDNPMPHNISSRRSYGICPT